MSVLFFLIFFKKYTVSAPCNIPAWHTLLSLNEAEADKEGLLFFFDTSSQNVALFFQDKVICVLNLSSLEESFLPEGWPVLEAAVPSFSEVL